MVRPLVSLAALAVVTSARIATADAPKPSVAAPVGLATPELARASDPIDDGTRPVRRRDASLPRVLRGPFQSSRLFAMPTADTIGAYVLSVGGDGSLLQETGVLTS